MISNSQKPVLMVPESRFLKQTFFKKIKIGSCMYFYPHAEDFFNRIKILLCIKFCKNSEKTLVTIAKIST